MQNDLKLPFGLKDGELVSIDSVPSGLECGCVCPVCNKKLVARKGDKKVHYFAHHSIAKCSGETLLHYLAKYFLAKRIRSSINRNEEFQIRWKCNTCFKTHIGNLVKNVVSMQLEVDFKVCRPDLVLLDEKNEVFAFLEVVVSHHPEEIVVEYCKKNGVFLLIIVIKKMSDIDRIVSNSPLDLKSNSACISKRIRKSYHVAEMQCWKCKKNMKVAFSIFDGVINTPKTFKEQDVEIVRKFGVIINQSPKSTMWGSSLSNMCGKCGSFVGEFELLDYCSQLDLSNPVYKIT